MTLSFHITWTSSKFMPLDTLARWEELEGVGSSFNTLKGARKKNVQEALCGALFCIVCSVFGFKVDHLI